jgi:hypothetical protein
MATYESKYAIGDTVFILEYETKGAAIVRATIEGVSFRRNPDVAPFLFNYYLEIPVDSNGNNSNNYIFRKEKNIWSSRQAAIIALAEQSELFN